LEKQPRLNRTSKIILSIAISFICCFCIGIAYFGYFTWNSFQPIENAEIVLSYPPVVEVGDEFIIGIEIVNISDDESITLNTINIGAEFVDGIQIGDSSPIFEMRDHYEVIGTKLDIFIFNELILVGETLTVEFEARAVKSGDFSGQMIICLDDASNCEMLVLRTVVEEGSPD
jgi:hypothetical protein